jgi:hypothetical protein
MKYSSFRFVVFYFHPLFFQSKLNASIPPKPLYSRTQHQVKLKQMKYEQQGFRDAAKLGDWRDILTSEILDEPDSVRRLRILKELQK